MGLKEDLISEYNLSEAEANKIITECKNILYCFNCGKLVSILKKSNLNLNSFKEFDFFRNTEAIERFCNNLMRNIKLLETTKEKSFIQGVLNSKYFLFCEFLSDDYKLEKNKLNKMTVSFNKLKDDEKIKVLEKMSIINKMNLEPIELKQKYIEIFLNDKISIDKQKILTNFSDIKIESCLDLINKLEESKNQESTFRLGLDNFNINKNEPLYNKDYYNFIKDERISKDKIDVIKYAYFQNGIDLNELKKDLENELYNCSAEQLKNYVDAFTKYKDGYINTDEYFFSKAIIEENSITQKEISKDVLPAIENTKLTQKEIRECIDIGKDRNVGDTKKYINLAETAKEFNYNDFEIMLLLKDSREKPTENIYLKENMIKEYGNSNLTTVLKLNQYKENEMDTLIHNHNMGRDLNDFISLK